MIRGGRRERGRSRGRGTRSRARGGERVRLGRVGLRSPSGRKRCFGSRLRIRYLCAGDGRGGRGGGGGGMLGVGGEAFWWCQWLAISARCSGAGVRFASAKTRCISRARADVHPIRLQYSMRGKRTAVHLYHPLPISFSGYVEALKEGTLV